MFQFRFFQVYNESQESSSNEDSLPSFPPWFFLLAVVFVGLLAWLLYIGLGEAWAVSEIVYEQIK